MASPYKHPAIPATTPIYLKIKIDDANLVIPKEINLTELSQFYYPTCKTINCVNMKKLIELIKNTIYNDNIGVVLIGD